MKSKCWILAVLLHAHIVLSQTPDQFVTQGRWWLAATNIAAAKENFAHALTLAPNHEAANVLYGATRLLALFAEPAGSNFLNRAGISVDGRDLYQWTAEPSRDEDGSLAAPPGMSAADFTAMLRTNVLPAIVAAESNLAKVAQASFLLDLSAAETRVAPVTLDRGDVLLLRSALKAAEYVIYTLRSWNIDVQLAAVKSFTTNEIGIDEFLASYPQFLNFATTNDLLAARAAFQGAVDRYMEASAFIRARPAGLVRLFNFEPELAEDEERFRTTLEELRVSLAAAVPLSVETNYTLFLAPHFSGQHPLRSFLPEMKHDGFVMGTLPDETFGGVVFGFERDPLEQSLAEWLTPYPSMWPRALSSQGEFRAHLNLAKNRSYVVQGSTNLTHWEDEYVFVALGGPQEFDDAIVAPVDRRFYRVQECASCVPAIPLGTRMSGLSGATGSERGYRVTVPPGLASVTFRIVGGEGDCDLHVRRGEPATRTGWDYRPYDPGNYETVVVANPEAGDWYLMLHGFSAYSGMTLQVY